MADRHNTGTILTKDVKKAVQVEVYDDFEQLRPIQQKWDEFVESVGSEIFLTYDWCRIWWKYYGKNRDLRVFVFRNDNNLVGIIPVFFERIRLGLFSVKVIKIVGSDFTFSQFSMPLAWDYMRSVIEKFFKLIVQYKWDVMHIGPIAGLYNRCGDLKDVFSDCFGNSHHVLIENKNVETYFKLAPDWETQLSRLNKNERGNIRRNYNVIRRFASDPAHSLQSCFVTENNFTESFDAFIAMHQSHWNNLGKAGHFKDWPAAREFHRELAQENLNLGRLRLLKVSIGSNCLGYQYHYKCGDRYYHFLDARAAQSPLKGVTSGRITFCEQIKKAMEENIFCIDSMRGEYEHKLRLGGQLFPMKSLYIIPKKLSAAVNVLLFRAAARLIDLCYYKIWYCRIAPRLPLKSRPLWQIWVRTNAFS
ncbi:MAG: GNAT family N-acetyltransferase [Planctomycetota bacterium]|jgi:CelD/BcsL family acetyltransferase involved in cellulose biosynthesis